MSLARRRRLEHLEDLARRRSPANPYVDPFPLCMRLLAAFEAEHAAVRARRVRPERTDLSDEDKAAFDRAVRDADRMNARLTAKPPEVA